MGEIPKRWQPYLSLWERIGGFVVSAIFILPSVLIIGTAAIFAPVEGFMLSLVFLFYVALPYPLIRRCVRDLREGRELQRRTGLPLREALYEIDLARRTAAAQPAAIIPVTRDPDQVYFQKYIRKACLGWVLIGIVLAAEGPESWEIWQKLALFLVLSSNSLIPLAVAWFRARRKPDRFHKELRSIAESLVPYGVGIMVEESPAMRQVFKKLTAIFVILAAVLLLGLEVSSSAAFTGQNVFEWAVLSMICWVLYRKNQKVLRRA